jgi:hypothetical protein
LNKWDDENTCKLVHKPIGSATLSELGEFLEKSAAFITPDQTLENALRSKADLPERDVDNLYIATPTATSQAISQRIGMLRSAETNDSDKEGSGLTEGNRGDDLAGKT